LLIKADRLEATQEQTFVWQQDMPIDWVEIPMKPRITISTNDDGGLEIYLNPLGRDWLVRELQHLTDRSDHFHLGAECLDSEVPLQSVPYCLGDHIFQRGKVLFRPDQWDAEHFPHVLATDVDNGS
jgi:hypothetical protein